jgi:hypothetical protein
MATITPNGGIVGESTTVSRWPSTNEYYVPPSIPLSQSQSTTSGAPTGPVRYVAPPPQVTIENGVRTTSYNIQDLQLNAKAEAYTAARAQGKSEQEAENISATAGNNAGSEALSGIYTDYNTRTGGTTGEGTVGDAPSAASSAGFGSAPDDATQGQGTVSGTNVLLNASGQPGGLITPRDNVLDGYASYTYNIGWYLLTPPQMTVVSTNGQIDISKWSLLVQSGGASNQVQTASQIGSAKTSPDPALKFTTSSAQTKNGTVSGEKPGRNKYFTFDYYLDDLEITSQVAGEKPGTNTEMTFKVTEPNGITLLPNLNNAVRELGAFLNDSPAQAHYCLVIKFYGWDINGNLVTVPGQTSGTPGLTPNNKNSIITKYYPFIIKNLNFKISNKMVEYDIICGPVSFEYASSTGFGSVPYNIEITGETVGQVLSGDGNLTPTPISDGREAVSTPAPVAVQKPTPEPPKPLYTEAKPELGTIKGATQAIPVVPQTGETAGGAAQMVNIKSARQQARDIKAAFDNGPM